MLPAKHSISLFDFTAAISSIDVRRPLAIPPYARRSVLSSAGHACPICSQAYDYTNPRGYPHPVIGTCIHPLLGGPMTADNYFVCCRRCQNSRQASDLISVASLPDDLRDQRSTVLQMSTNHLVPLPRSADLPQVRAALTARHAFPRSRVYAAQCDDGTCFIAVAARYGDGQSKGLAHLLGRLAGSPVHVGKRLTVYRFTDDAFRQTVWNLIEANALVVGLARRGVLRDHLDWWWLTSASVGELRARKVGRLAAPDPDVDKKVSGSALRQRRLVARRRLEDELWLAQRELDEAQFAADLFMEARANPGAALAVDPDEAVEVMLRPAALEQRLAQLKTEFEEVRKRAA